MLMLSLLILNAIKYLVITISCRESAQPQRTLFAGLHHKRGGKNAASSNLDIAAVDTKMSGVFSGLILRP